MDKLLFALMEWKRLNPDAISIDFKWVEKFVENMDKEDSTDETPD